MARGAVAGGARNADHRCRRGLLRPRRRVSGGGAARLAHPHPGSGVLRRRHLRRPTARGDGVGDRGRGRGDTGGGVLHAEADAAADAVAAVAPRCAAVHRHGCALAALPADRERAAAARAGVRRASRGAVVGPRGGPASVRDTVRPDGDRRARGATAAVRCEAGRLSPGRLGAPAAVARRPVRRPDRRGGSGRRTVGDVLCAAAGGEDRPRRRHAHAPADHRDARGRFARIDRAGSRPDRLLDRW